MWRVIRSFVSNPNIQAMVISFVVALVEELLEDSAPEPIDDQ